MPVTGSPVAISGRTVEGPRSCAGCRSGSTSAATLHPLKSTPTAIHAVIVGSFAALTTPTPQANSAVWDRCVVLRACPRRRPTTLLLANRRTEFHDAALAAVVDHLN